MSLGVCLQTKLWVTAHSRFWRAACLVFVSWNVFLSLYVPSFHVLSADLAHVFFFFLLFLSRLGLSDSLEMVCTVFFCRPLDFSFCGSISSLKMAVCIDQNPSS